MEKLRISNDYIEEDKDVLAIKNQIREFYFEEKIEEDFRRDTAINPIAKTIGHTKTLESQNSDSLDFHDISVWTLKEMLVVAYELGKNSNK